ncbi:MAG: hypothetical protein Q7R64_04475 [bacterium]|nr:hypothetical protein [bacterium]
MNWKNWPLWVKGGILGLLVGIIGTWVPMTIPFGNGPLAFALVDGTLKIIEFLSYPLGLLFCRGACEGEQVFAIVLTGPLSGLLYGVILGLLYGKIKT